MKKNVKFQVVTDMECVEAALKSSFRREVVAGKVGLQPFAEEFCGGVTVAPCEDFLVDELFDFSNVGGMDEEEEEEDEEKAREQKDGLEGEAAVVPCCSADSVGKEELTAVQTGELSVPVGLVWSFMWERSKLFYGFGVQFLMEKWEFLWVFLFSLGR